MRLIIAILAVAFLSLEASAHNVPWCAEHHEVVVYRKPSRVVVITEPPYVEKIPYTPTPTPNPRRVNDVMIGLINLKIEFNRFGTIVDNADVYSMGPWWWWRYPPQSAPPALKSTEVEDSLWSTWPFSVWYGLNPVTRDAISHFLMIMLVLIALLMILWRLSRNSREWDVILGTRREAVQEPHVPVVPVPVVPVTPAPVQPIVPAPATTTVPRDTVMALSRIDNLPNLHDKVDSLLDSIEKRVPADQVPEFMRDRPKRGQPGGSIASKKRFAREWLGKIPPEAHQFVQSET